MHQHLEFHDFKNSRNVWTLSSISRSSLFCPGSLQNTSATSSRYLKTTANEIRQPNISDSTCLAFLNMHFPGQSRFPDNCFVIHHGFTPWIYATQQPFAFTSDCLICESCNRWVAGLIWLGGLGLRECVGLCLVGVGWVGWDWVGGWVQHE